MKSDQSSIARCILAGPEAERQTPGADRVPRPPAATRRATAVVTRVSGDRSGGWMAPSVGPAIDAAGRVVTFTSRHPTDATDNRNDFDLFVRVK